MTPEKHVSKEHLPYSQEVIKTRAKFLEAVYFPEGKKPEEIMGEFASLSYLVKQGLEKVLTDSSKWHTLVEFSDFIAGSSTGTRETAIRARFGFDDGKLKNWKEVGEISGNIAGNVAYERVISAIERFRVIGRGSRIRTAMIYKWHVDAFS